MDVLFEVSKKLNTLCIQAASKRLDLETGFVYFDEKHPFNFDTKKIPFLENLSYALALLNQKNVEGFHAGEKILETLFCFYKEGNFPKYIHEFPKFESPYIGVFSYPYFYQIRKNFKSYLKSELFERLQIIMEDIKQSVSKLMVYHHLEPLIKAIFNQRIENLYYSFESALAFVMTSRENLPHKLVSQEIKFTENGHVMLSLFDFIKAQKEGLYPLKLLSDHPLHLKLSLFYEPFEKKEIPEDFFENSLFPIGYRWDSENGQEHVLTFDEVSKTQKSHTITFEGSLELHTEFGLYFPSQMQILQNNQKGTYFVKNDEITVTGLGKIFKISSTANLALEYQKRKQELFNSSCLALKNQTSGPFKIHLEII